jgi:hypothetical protein
MGILLAFAPFIAFAIVAQVVGGTAGLVVGGATSAALLIRDRLSNGGPPKVLELGTTILFVALALYALFGDPGWSIFSVRLRVDAGLLLIVLGSIAIRRPFTLRYAREQVPPEHWNSPVFIRSNYVITAVWALAFVVLVGSDVIVVYLPSLPSIVGIGATVLALVIAVKFTEWYPKRVRARAAG